MSIQIVSVNGSRFIPILQLAVDVIQQQQKFTVHDVYEPMINYAQPKGYMPNLWQALTEPNILVMFLEKVTDTPKNIARVLNDSQAKGWSTKSTEAMDVLLLRGATEKGLLEAVAGAPIWNEEYVNTYLLTHPDPAVVAAAEKNYMIGYESYKRLVVRDGWSLTLATAFSSYLNEQWHLKSGQHTFTLEDDFATGFFKFLVTSGKKRLFSDTLNSAIHSPVYKHVTGYEELGNYLYSIFSTLSKVNQESAVRIPLTQKTQWDIYLNYGATNRKMVSAMITQPNLDVALAERILDDHKSSDLRSELAWTANSNEMLIMLDTKTKNATIREKIRKNPNWI